MRFVAVVVIVCSLLALAGCAPVPASGNPRLVGSGKLITRDYTREGFTRIDAGSNFQVTVHAGEAFEVSVTADDNVHEHLTVAVKGGELSLGMKPGENFELRNVTMKAEVSLPSLESAATSANADIHLGEVSGGRLKLKGYSNGIIDGQVAVGQLEVDAASNGNVNLKGSADALTVMGGGNAILKLENLAARTARVDLNSNAKANVRATEKLDYAVVGNGGLNYSGGAKLGEQTTGGNGYARGR